MSRGPKHYTAGTTDPPVVQRVVTKLEGLLQDIREQRPTFNEDGSIETKDTRPNMFPHVYVATHLGCSVYTIKRWLALHAARRDDHEISEAFCDVYERIATEIGESISRVSFVIAKNPAHPQALAAQKLILPKTDEWMFGNLSVKQTAAKQLADYPSELFDEMPEEVKQRLREIEDEQDARDQEIDDIIKQAKQRVKDQEEIATG